MSVPKKAGFGKPICLEIFSRLMADQCVLHASWMVKVVWLSILCIHAISLVAAGNALLTKRDPRSALGWTVTLVFLPVIGLILYLIFGIGRAHSRAEKIMQKLARITAHYNALHISLADYPAPPTEQQKRMDHLGQKVSGETLCPGNSVVPLHNGDNAYPEMLEAIYASKDHAYLSSYIFNYGHVALAFITALEDAHKRGVDVRVLVDGIGALYSWRKPWRILAEKKVPVHRFRPPTLFPPNFGINLRSHRKALICDGTGFSGGMNIADGDVMDMPAFDERVLQIQRQAGVTATVTEEKVWHMPFRRVPAIQDIQYKFKGTVVEQLRKAFLLNWSFCSGDMDFPPASFSGVHGDCVCRVIMDGPGDDADALNDLMSGVIELAQKSVMIMMPYFLPTPELTGALRGAGQRGVDVRVILPAENNLPFMSWATQRILPDLLKAGVRVWHQKPPFAHTKLMCVDGFYSLVGSANMDARSLRLNFELDTEIYDANLASDLMDFMNTHIENGREITEETLKNRSLLLKLRDSACWIFSPYL